MLVPKSRAGMVWRVLAAAVLVIGACAGAVATAGLLQFNSFAQALRVHAGVSVKQLTLPRPGAPETILLIGSDHRAHESYRLSHTDTILLVHLNANSSTINVMSIPRDLKVNVRSRYVPQANCASSTVPGDCAEKINEAYSQGGYGLLISTIKHEVFPDLTINHIVDTNFEGFSDLVDAIGCVYVDVDHRYYNHTEPYPSPDNYSSIDIQPGYQRLCGHHQAVDGALPFVRFRHTDSDLVRAARQQDFLRWAKQNFTTRQLFDERARLLHIIAEHSTFDKRLQTQDGLLELFDLLLGANGGTLKQIPFPANLSQASTGEDFVLPQSTGAVRRAYLEFMRPTRHTSSSAGARPASGGSAHRSHGAVRHHASAGIDTLGLVADPADGRAQAKLLAPDMGVYYPDLIDAHSAYCSDLTPLCLNASEPGAAYAHSYPRQYTVREPAGRRAHAYFMTIALTNAGLGQYYGVQGLHWTGPPILGHPQQIKRFHGRTYELFADDGGHITDVSFRVGPNVYWISNTLTSALPNREMVSIAESMTLYRG